MTHKVNPVVFRLGINKNWQSNWFDFKNMPKYLEQDLIIRRIIMNEFKKEGIIESIEIDRLANVINIIINTSRSGLIIGRKGTGVESLKKKIEKALKQTQGEKQTLKFHIKEVKNFFSFPSLIAQSVALQIEKRTPFRVVLKRTLEKVSMDKNIKGVRIVVAGRLNGIEIARTEWLQYGNLPRQTIRNNIEYAQTEAYCTYGVIGVKVWLYK
jgi:small subunit ribosomal protein S3